MSATPWILGKLAGKEDYHYFACRRCAAPHHASCSSDE